MEKVESPRLTEVHALLLTRYVNILWKQTILVRVPVSACNFLFLNVSYSNT